MKYSPMNKMKLVAAAVFLMSAMSANATPFSPSWMKSSISKGNGAVTPGELDGGGNGLPGGGPLAIPLPGTVWLLAVGVAGLVSTRRKK